MSMQLTEGALEAILGGSELENPIMQVLGCKKVATQQGKDRYRLLLSDGRHVINFAMLASQVNEKVNNGDIVNFTVIKIKRYITSTLQSTGKVEKKILVILDLEVLLKGDEVNEKLGDPKQLTIEDASGAAQGNNKNSMNTSSYSAPKPTSTLPAVSTSTFGGSTSTFNASNYEKNQSNGLNQTKDQTFTHPILSLSPYQKNWVIKARVMNKSGIRTWSNSKGEGKLFSFEICDESGEIRVTAFKDEADRFFDMIQPDKVYYIQNCMVKPTNKQFNKLNHEYELTAMRDTQITECHDDMSKVPSITFNFVSFDKVINMEQNSVIDIIGVCKESGEQVNFVSRNQKELKKRELTLVDQSNTAVVLTLWGKEAEDFDGSTQPIVAVKSARVSEFQGAKSLACMMSSMFRVDPDIPEAHKLRGWFDNGGAQLEITNISKSGSQNVPSNCRLMTFEEVKTEQLGYNAAADYYQVNAFISLIRSENCVYKACFGEDCNKKVVEMDALYRCEKCKTETPYFKYRLLLSMNLVDVTNSQWVTCFANEGEKILSRTSQEIGEWLENDNRAALNHISSCILRRYNFTCRVKLESFNDESRLKTVVIKVSDVNYKNINQNLLEKIRFFTGIGKVSD